MNRAYGSYGSWLSQIQQVVTSYTPGGIAYSYARDQRAWLTERKVRTFADFRAMADWALEQAGKEKPAAREGFEAARGQIRSIFPDQTPIPVSFDRLIQLLSSVPEIQRRVKVKKAEYQGAVVSKLSSGESAVAVSGEGATVPYPDNLTFVDAPAKSEIPWAWILGGGVALTVTLYVLSKRKSEGSP